MWFQLFFLVLVEEKVIKSTFSIMSTAGQDLGLLFESIEVSEFAGRPVFTGTEKLVETCTIHALPDESIKTKIFATWCKLLGTIYCELSTKRTLIAESV